MDGRDDTGRVANRAIFSLQAKYFGVLSFLGLAIFVSGLLLRDSASQSWVETVAFWLERVGLGLAALSIVLTCSALLDREAARHDDGWRHSYPQAYRVIFWSLAAVAVVLFIVLVWYTTTRGLVALS